MSAANTPNSALSTERVFNYTPEQVFEAIQDPERLAQWWGPTGFANTFEQFEFTPGGRWVFVMHGPDGTNYPNECVFRVIQPDSKIVIDHVCQPLFTLSITLTAQGDKTHLKWVQQFQDPAVAEKLRSICEPANEQNLDRLEEVLGSENM